MQVVLRKQKTGINVGFINEIMHSLVTADLGK